MEVIYNEGLHSCIEINFGEYAYMITPSEAMRLKKMLEEVLENLPVEEEK